MSIAASDLKAYGSANMPEDDTSSSGGAIDTACKVELTQLGSNDTVDVVSDGSDTRNITVTSRDSTGKIVSETLTLNGTTTVNGAQTCERILKVVAASSDASRTVTVKKHGDGSTICTLDPSVTKVRTLFYDSSSDPSSQKVRYEKLFWKNTHGSLQLNSAAMKLTADPAAVSQMGLATAINDTGSVSNRLSAPGGVTFVGVNVGQNVPGNALASGDRIGVWIQETLAAGNAPVRSSFTTQLTGTSV